jgi:Co/Zn/Cd efflux system component
VAVLGLPLVEVTGVIAFLALAGNVASVVLLTGYKEADANVRSVWLCSRNDAIGNIAMMGAAAAVSRKSCGRACGSTAPVRA